MTYHIDAIYEGGVLKPLEPLILPDQARVKITVESTETQTAESEVLVNQKAALAQALDAVEQLPLEGPNDGFSGRDHDLVLYGWKK
jgi:predicted DNA-binding antitoxin AbrB/MazE fold protein